MRALGRRTPKLNIDGLLTFANITLNPHSLILECDGEEIKLTLKESQLLEILIKNNNLVVSKETFIEVIWGYDTNAEDNYVETHISLLRKKLSRLKTRVIVRTVRGLGYTLVEERKP